MTASGPVPTERELAAMSVLRAMTYGPKPVRAPRVVWAWLQKRGLVRSVTLQGRESFIVTGEGDRLTAEREAAARAWYIKAHGCPPETHGVETPEPAPGPQQRRKRTAKPKPAQLPFEAAP